MRVDYVILPRADEDLDDIADYFVEKDSLELSLKFLDSAHETFSLLATQPDMGWPCSFSNKLLKNARKFLVAGVFGKYLVFYEFRNNRVEIIRVLHGARDLDALFEE